MNFGMTLGSGRIIAGQDDLIGIPAGGPRGKRVVIMLHGQLQQTTAWVTPAWPGQMNILQTLVAAGFVCLAGYYDGPQWGNATAVADIETFRGFAATLGCRNDKVLLHGASMGNYDGLAYLAAHPDRVAALASSIPACDINDVRDNNRGGNTQQWINTAWGMPAGSTSATNPLPAGASMLDPANIAAMVSANAPIRFYYSAGDTVVVPGTVTAMRDALNAARPGICIATQVSAVLDHGDAAMGAMPMSEVVQLYAAVA